MGIICTSKKSFVFLTFTEANEKEILDDVLPIEIIEFLVRCEENEKMREKCRAYHLPPGERTETIIPAPLTEQKFYKKMIDYVQGAINSNDNNIVYRINDVFENSAQQARNYAHFHRKDDCDVPRPLAPYKPHFGKIYPK